MSDKNKEVEEIDLEEVKTLHKKVDLLVLDDEEVTYNSQRLTGAKLDVNNPVPLVSDGKVIGSATVYREGNVVVGDLYIDAETPERLDLENGEKLYAHVQGYNETVDGPQSLIVRVAFVKSIYLTKEPPHDTRVGRV